MDGRAFSFLPINRRELAEIRGPYYSVMGARYLTEAYVATGGWIEHVLARGSPEDVARYIGEAQALGFDLIELSTGFISLPRNDLVALIKAVKSAGMRAKPELGIQFGAGGATKTAELAAEGTRDVRCLLVDHSQIVQLECLRAGIWGTKSAWGRVTTFKP